MSWKLRLFIYASVGTSILVAVACNTGGFTAPPGLQCIQNYEYVSLTGIPPQNVITLDATKNTAQQMPAGVYMYASSAMFYEDTTPGNLLPFAVDVGDSASTAGIAEHSGRGCVLNYSQSLAPFTVQAYVPDNITIDENLNQTINFRQFQLAVDPASTVVNGNILITVQPENPANQSTNMATSFPDTGMQNVKLAVDTPPVLLKNSPTDYQYIAKYNYSAPGDPHTYSFWVSSHMNWTLLPVPGTP